MTRASWRSDECRGGQWSEGECVLAGGLGVSRICEPWFIINRDVHELCACLVIEGHMSELFACK